MGASTCGAVENVPDSPSLLQNGNLVFQAHHVGWIVAAFFTITAMVTSFWLVAKHLRWYTNKREQRYIVRLLFMVPIYAVISLASYLFWNNATPLLLIRDAYESTVLTSFFYLLLIYLSPNPEDQKAIFLKVGLSRAADAAAVAKGEEIKKWVFPLGFIKSKPADGLYFLQMMKWGVLQYCVIRPLTTLVAVILNYAGWYCEGSFNPRWGYIYILAIVSLSVSIAMYCLIQLYVPVAMYLAPQKPLLKLFAVKAVVFLTFWQATVLSGLSLLGVVKDTTYMTAEDINIGIGALLECFEMMLFGFLHLRAFSYKPYRPIHDPKSKTPPPTPTPRLRSLGHVLDFRETFREIRIGWIYIWDKMCGREPTPDKGARRIAHYESAFGRPRPSDLPKILTDTGRSEANAAEKGLLSPSKPKERWLGHDRREKSESLEVQIARELQRRGYDSHIPGRGHIGAPHDADGAPNHKPQRSWWRSVYTRVSQSGPEPEEEQHLTPQPSRQKKSKSKSRTRGPGDIEAGRGLLLEHDYDFEDPPPQPISHRNRPKDRRQRPVVAQEEHLDTLAPLSVFNVRHSSHQTRQQKQRSSSNPTPLHYPPPSDAISPQSYSQPLGMSFPPTGPIARSDSLLGRVFPLNADNMSSVDHSAASDSGRSLPSVSTHGVTPSRATPRGGLIPTVPALLGKYPTSEQSALRAPVAPGSQVTHTLPPALSAEIVHPNRSAPYDNASRSNEYVGQGSHIRESAQHLTLDRQPVLTLNTTSDGFVTSPLSAEFEALSIAPSVPGPSRSAERPTPPEGPAPGLRRSSAQVYSPDSPSRKRRHSSLLLEVTPPQVPKPGYTREPHRRNQEPRERANRRTSAPPEPASQNGIASYQEEELRRAGYAVENMSSAMTQPSLSGTPEANKYTSVTSQSSSSHHPRDKLPRVPGMPQPLEQLPYQRDLFTGGVGSAQLGYPSRREEAGPSRRPTGQPTTPRSNNHAPRTTHPRPYA